MCRRCIRHGRRCIGGSGGGSGPGVWTQILAQLQARTHAAGLIGWTVSVDSTISRAHQHAAGARRDGEKQKEPPGGLNAQLADHGARPLARRLDHQDPSGL
jgi:hypothetical protein